jgi:hypothetical protein
MAEIGERPLAIELRHREGGVLIEKAAGGEIVGHGGYLSALPPRINGRLERTDAKARLRPARRRN